MDGCEPKGGGNRGKCQCRRGAEVRHARVTSGDRAGVTTTPCGTPRTWGCGGRVGRRGCYCRQRSCMGGEGQRIGTVIAGGGKGRGETCPRPPQLSWRSENCAARGTRRGGAGEGRRSAVTAHEVAARSGTLRCGAVQMVRWCGALRRGGVGSGGHSDGGGACCDHRSVEVGEEAALPKRYRRWAFRPGNGGKAA